MSSTGLLMSYLADLNYIAYFCGHDIRSPPFVKNMHDPLSTDKPIYEFNSWERSYYKKHTIMQLQQLLLMMNC